MFRAFSEPQRGQRVAGADEATGDAEAGALDPTWPPAPVGAPQAWQNAFCGGFSRWHCRQIMR
jgi:hypothetical protein